MLPGSAFQAGNCCREVRAAVTEALYEVPTAVGGKEPPAGRYGALRIRCVTWADPLKLGLNARMVATPRATEIRTSTQLRVALGKRLSVI